MKEKGNHIPQINWKLFVLCVAIVILGYILLYFGSTKIAPVLIVVGYILTGLTLTPFKKEEKENGKRPEEK